MNLDAAVLLAFPCRQCFADIGEKCVTLKGKPRHYAHNDRHRRYEVWVAEQREARRA